MDAKRKKKLREREAHDKIEDDGAGHDQQRDTAVSDGGPRNVDPRFAVIRRHLGSKTLAKPLQICGKEQR